MEAKAIIQATKDRMAAKYWYVTEIKSCVLCGVETINKHRVFEKPNNQERIKWQDTGCHTHF